ncbi:unnamed protein product [Cylindrotheca closterium]|uniref:HSF-type DNA-binding domain-containing protein n=1 Tax=Cylindrotheca closterium TaxID=2856 RepID=A0AAD2CFP6_9STRA|nr:unnamed protein product [Cylindrotheca closterium]
MPLFPYKLHELLTEMQSNDHLSSIISWMQSGNAFKIHEPLLFEEILLQKYFPRQTQINSFKRQLLYYGFDNLGNGIFAHPCFLKDKRHLCGQINHTNPTKSQREGMALIPSRRIRGKRAKHALTQRLKVPVPLISTLTAGSNDGDGGRQSSIHPTAIHSGVIPNQYWTFLDTSFSPKIASLRMLSFDLPTEDQNLPAPTEPMVAPINRMSGLSQMDSRAFFGDAIFQLREQPISLSQGIHE